MKREWRLRDVRRRWADLHRCPQFAWARYSEEFTRFIVALRGTGTAVEITPKLDRLISLLGPDTLIRDVDISVCHREHKIGANAPIGDGEHTNADTHGGDGNNGECDHAAESTPDGPRKGTCAPADGADGAGGSPACVSQELEPPTDRGDTGADEVTEGMGSQVETEHAVLADNAADGDGRPAESDAADRDDTTTAADRLDRDAGSPDSRPDLTNLREAARIARALSYLAGDLARSEPSPLWDSRRIVSELVTRQYRVHRMHQDVRRVQAVLVVHDMSGSCAWVAQKTWAIAARLASMYPYILAVPTCGPSLGHEGSIMTGDIYGHGPVLQAVSRCPNVVDDCGTGGDLDGWRRLLAAGITHLLALGDAHGQLGYQTAAEAGIEVLWANPNSHIAPPDHPAWCRYAEIQGEDIATAVELLVTSVQQSRRFG